MFGAWVVRIGSCMAALRGGEATDLWLFLMGWLRTSDCTTRSNFLQAKLQLEADTYEIIHSVGEATELFFILALLLLNQTPFSLSSKRNPNSQMLKCATESCYPVIQNFGVLKVMLDFWIFSSTEKKSLCLEVDAQIRKHTWKWIPLGPRCAQGKHLQHCHWARLPRHTSASFSILLQLFELGCHLTAIINIPRENNTN